jgi:hypothetical protein
MVSLSLVAGVFVVVSGGSVSITACGDSSQCVKVRNEMFAKQEQWADCNPFDPEPCIKVFGNRQDCSGVLFCDFAVNPIHRLEAEQAVLTIANQTQGCYLCATPACVGGELTACEPISHKCILFTNLVDGGSNGGSSQGPPDVSIPPIPTIDAAGGGG